MSALRRHAINPARPLRTLPPRHAASGRGRVASFTWVERGPSAAFREPYMLALIDLDEGVRLMMNILDAQPDAIAIGDPVRIVFEVRQPDGPILPQARALRPSSAQPETP